MQTLRIERRSSGIRIYRDQDFLGSINKSTKTDQYLYKDNEEYTAEDLAFLSKELSELNEGLKK